MAIGNLMQKVKHRERLNSSCIVAMPMAGLLWLYR